MFELLLGWWLGPAIRTGTAIAIGAFLAVWMAVMFALWALGMDAEGAILLGIIAGLAAAIAAPRFIRPRPAASA